MKVVSDKRAQDATERLQKEKELSKIKVSKEDVELIVSYSDDYCVTHILSIDA